MNEHPNTSQPLDSWALKNKAQEVARTIVQTHRDAEDMLNVGEDKAGLGLLQDAHNLLSGILSDVEDARERLLLGRCIHEELFHALESREAADNIFEESEAPVSMEMIREMTLDEQLPQATATPKSPRF